MKKIVTTVLCSLLLTTACSKEEFKSNYNYKGNHNPVSADNLPEQNLLRAMQLTDAAVENYFEGNNMTLAEKYNPYTDAREGTGSVWVYTSCIEAVNAVIDGLKTLRDRGDATLYDQHYSRYAELLDKLYLNAGFYRGTFTLTSYTQTREWTVYAVNRSSGDMGTADVSGIMNVYDDQMWLIRETEEGIPLADESKEMEIKGVTEVRFEVEPFLNVEFVGDPMVSNGKITARVRVTRGVSEDIFREKIEPMGSYDDSFQNVTDIQLFVSYSSTVGYRARDERWSNKIEYSGSEFESLLGEPVTIKSLGTIPSGRKVFIRAAARINYDTPKGSGTRRWNYSAPVEVMIP